MKKVYLGNLQKKDGVPAFQFHNLQRFSELVGHAVFFKDGGTSSGPFESLNLSFTVDDNFNNVIDNRRIVCRALRIPEENLVSAHQIHGRNIQIIDENFMAKRKTFGNESISNEVEDTDAFITKMKNVGLMIKLADCQGIVLFDPVKNVLACVHAGWRGLVKNVSGHTIAAMKKYFGVDPATLQVSISPSLGPCCAFFSEPEKELPASFAKYIDDQKRVNLWDYSADQLKANGIIPQNLEIARVCTVCGAGGKFFSFRRDHAVSGRFGVVAVLR